MSWELVTKEQSWLKEWYELNPKFRVKCREVSCKREEILYVSIDNFKKHMEETHQKIAFYENDKSEIQYPGSHNWKYFMIWKELQIQSPFFKNFQTTSKITQFSILCILCEKIIPCNNKSARDNHITKEHSDIENEYRERNFPDFWPWKYQTKLELDFFVKCNHCGKCVTLELSTRSLKKHYEENHKKIWERKFKQGEAHNQPGPSAGTFARPSAGTSARPSAGPRQPRAKRTLQAVFEKHSWMKKCYEYQPNTHFTMKCRTCNKELLYVIITRFKKHIERNHKEIFELEKEKYNLLNYEFNWTRFIQTNQREIKCLLCPTIVTDESKINHVQYHILNPSPLDYDFEKPFNNIGRSWPWKYTEYDGDYSVKCKLCKRSLQLLPSNLQEHYRNSHLDQWIKIEKDEEDILEQGEAHDQAGPSTQLLENREDRTLLSEFEKHNWLKICYKCQSDLDFSVICLVESCKDRVLYVDIKNFAEHMQTNHIQICELENKKCSPPGLDVNWIYFMYKEQGEIKCLKCETTVTDESTDNHAQNHISKDSVYFKNCNNINRFINIEKNWVWKYQRRIGEYIVKCILCKESPRIHLTPDTTNLKNHYKNMHKGKWKEYIWKQEKLQEQAGPSRKLQKTS